MIRTGKVVEKENGMLSVQFERPEACENCGGCVDKRCTSVSMPGEADVGDTVDVEMPDKNVVGASAISYVVPLLLLLLSLFLGARVHAPLGVSMDVNVFVALCGLLGLVPGFLIVFAVDKGLRKRRNWQPKVVAVHKRLV